MCSGSCSRSPKWVNSAGRKTMDYDLGSGGRHNSPEGTMYAPCRRAQSPSAAPYGVHIRGLVTDYMGINTPGITHAHTLSQVPP